MKINKQLLDRYLLNKYALTIVGLLLFIIAIYLGKLYNEHYEKKEKEEYKTDIVHVNSELKGYVVDYSMSKVYAGTKLANLSSGQKFFVYIPVSNSVYKGKMNNLFYGLEEGDFLYKPTNTDSIFVIKPDGNRFLFIAPRWR